MIVNTSNFPLIAGLTLIAACTPAKKITETPVAAAVVTVDTTKTERLPAKAAIYRGSNSRTNDLLHTRLEVSFDWNKCRMNGKANLLLKPYFAPVSVLYLNARGMDILKLEVRAIQTEKIQKKTGNKITEQIAETRSVSSTSYVYENDSLKINLGRTFNASENYEVYIEYTAKPNELKKVGGSDAISEDKGLYFINPTGEHPYKMPQIWTQGETQANSVWFPTIDSPNERMTQEIYITVDDKFTTLSNGLLISSKKFADNTRTDYWKLDEPHAPYLAMMAVGTFKKVNGEAWNGKEISYYVDPEYETYAAEIFKDTREMVDFYSKKLGVPYAWPKYAQVVAHDYVSGAMENTSATLHGDFMVYQSAREMVDGKKGNDVIAHELFHQWFGDLVTCESWSNLPLNESFATYGEYLWLEYKEGRAAADQHHWQSRQGHLRSQQDATPIRFNYLDKEEMFDAVSYNKGGQILHMLRKAVGDEVFFAALKLYLTSHQFKAVEIHNLRLAFEEVSGQDLNWFFNQWFLAEGRPHLQVSVKQNADGDLLLMTEQTQDLSKMPLYRLPLYVDVYSDNKATRQLITLQNQRDTFKLKVKGAYQFLNFDAERQLLCDLLYTKTKEQYLQQYALTPLYADRLEALMELESRLQEKDIYPVFMRAAKSDSASNIRLYAITCLEKLNPEYNVELKSLLRACYETAKSTKVRAAALNVLNKRFASDADVRDLNEYALREQSYAICGAALTYLTRHDVPAAMDRAKRFEKEWGPAVLYPVASLYAEQGTDANLLFFHDALPHFSGFEVLPFLNLYTKFAKKGQDVATAITAAGDMELVSFGANKFIKRSAVKNMNDLARVWEEKANRLAKEKETPGQNNAAVEAKIKEARETVEIIRKKANRVQES